MKVGLGLAALVGVMYLFAFPTRTYLEQRRDIVGVEQTISVLKAENAKLAAEGWALQDNSTIEQIARQEYGLVMPGQQAFMVLPSPAAAPAQVQKTAEHRPWYAPLEFWDRL
ncbi:MAG TPA: septum formation initiator family protein [Acidimicrobiales bacterium]|nr:septum formation initiator family protein [Acidimicrobiales bacterium]